MPVKKVKKAKKKSPVSSAKKNQKLEDLRNLKLQYLEHSRSLLTDALPELVKKMETSISKSIDIDQVAFNTPISLQAMWAIANTFHNYIPLKILSFYRTQLSPDAISALSNFVAHNSQIEYLQLIGCGLGNSSCTSLGGMCQRSTKLRLLALDYNDFGDKGASCIMKGCAASGLSAIQKMSLKYCGFGVESCKEVGRLLASNSPLADLDLIGNEIGDLGLQYLFKGLAFNTNLKRLSIANNQIVNGPYIWLSDGFEISEDDQLNGELSSLFPLCEVMQKNTSLAEIDLRGNTIGDAGAKMILEVQRVKRETNLKQVIWCSERMRTAVFLELQKINLSLVVKGKKGKGKGKKKKKK